MKFALLLLAVLLIGCGSSAATPTLPIPTPTPTSTPDIQPFVNQLTALMLDYRRDIGVMTGLLKSPAVTDKDWVAAFDRSASAIKGDGAKVRQLIAPACMAPRMTNLIQATLDLDKGVDGMNSALQQRNSGQLQESAALANAASDNVNQVLTLIEKGC